MAKLLVDYTVLDEEYENGEFCFFQGTDGVPANVEIPRNTGLTGIIGAKDPDPEVFSYMSGSEPHALVVIVTTNFTTGTSTARYSVCRANLNTSPISWDTANLPQNVGLVNGRDAVAGNPNGVVQVGNYLYILDYDSTNIYRLIITDFESTASGGNYQVNAITDLSGVLPGPGNQKRHGQALISLTNSGTTYFYGLYNYATEDSSHTPTAYTAGRLIRLTVDASGGLTNGTVVEVGRNAQALIPAPGGTDGVTILIPAIGGIQHAGSTNWSLSNLSRVPPFGSFTQTNVVTAFEGGNTGLLTPGGYYDIRSVAVSDDGTAYILTVTWDTNYNSWWKLFKGTVARILTSTNVLIETAVANNILQLVDSGLGAMGSYWEVLYENANPAANGRLWFIQGTPIRVSLGSDYQNKYLFDRGVLYLPVPPAYFPDNVNVNSVDLIGEMIYQAEKGASIDTRLIKNRQVAKAAAAKAGVEEEEEEK
jgi:hypothetical protein